MTHKHNLEEDAKYLQVWLKTNQKNWRWKSKSFEPQSWGLHDHMSHLSLNLSLFSFFLFSLFRISVSHISIPSLPPPRSLPQFLFRRDDQNFIKNSWTMQATPAVTNLPYIHLKPHIPLFFLKNELFLLREFLFRCARVKSCIFLQFPNIAFSHCISFLQCTA